MRLRYKRGRAFALALILTLILTATLPPAAAQSQPQSACFETTGRTLNDTYTSDFIPDVLRYSLYLPPCYDQRESYPVLYLLHGSNRTDEHWLSLGLAEVLDRAIVGGVLPPMVVAMPFGTWIANENRFVGNATWSNILLTEFVPTIESRYAVSTEREGRAIGGISRGGFWAFNVAFRYPHLFGAVGGHSAFFDPGHFPTEYNPLDLAQSAPELDTLRIWLDRGADDYAWYGLDLMGERLSIRGLPHQYIIYTEGEHTDSYWASHLLEYLTFYAANWQTNDSIVDLPAIQHDFDTSGSVDLYIPAVAFASLQLDVLPDRLLRVYAGLLDFDLILSESTYADLTGRGVRLNAGIRTVPDVELMDVLWSTRNLYTLLPITDLTPRLRPLNIAGLHPLDVDLSDYPFVFAGEGFNPADSTRMLFSGVTALARRTREVIAVNGVEWAASGIRDLVLRPDFFHISNEVSFAPRCPQSDEPVLGGLCAMDEHFELLTLLDVDIVELSGNHNNDYGFNAYLRTLELYESAGMMTVAGGRDLDSARQPLIIQHNGASIALLSCNWNGPDFALVTDTQPGAAYCVLDWLREAIPALKAAHDVVIVTLQYAEYDRYQPIERQVGHFRLMAELGADVVLGTQAHWPQTFEFYTAPDGREAFIHYGLGNLFFDQTGGAYTQFFMDEFLIHDGQLLGVSLHPGLIEDLARPRWMTPDEANDFLIVIFRESGF